MTDKNPEETPGEENAPLDFIREIVAEDVRTGRFGGRVQTRFPPEPNGYLHIGHAKAIYQDFSVAEDFNGICNLRFDDTNPVKEEQEYVDAQIRDLRWLGYEPANILYTSDYFDQLYAWAQQLIRQGDAYVDDLSADEMRDYRGTLTEPGRESPYRNRSVEENLDLLERMKSGEFPDGEKVLRAKIDMTSGNINLRDPVMYRIRHAEHQRTGNTWCIYPMYDWAHGQSDAIEGVTHSLCTLEYEDHRPLYDWYLDRLEADLHPRQIEFARLVLTYTIVSKRKLIRLVEEGHVSGWDDPRMPTLAGMRRRGVPAQAIREFCKDINVAKTNSVVELQLLEFHIRQALNATALRRMGVIDPIKVVITNWPAGEVEMREAVNNPEDERAGTRQVPFSGELYIEREDFMEVPEKKFYRLSPGTEVRLRWGYFVTCTDVIKNESGEIVEIHCTYDPETGGGQAPDGRRPKATIHWVSAAHAVDAQVRVYDNLFAVESPDDTPNGEDFTANLTPNSLQIAHAKVEPSVRDLPTGETIQFERKGYYVLDADSTPQKLIFNFTVGLRDAWSRIQNRK